MAQPLDVESDLSSPCLASSKVTTSASVLIALYFMLFAIQYLFIENAGYILRGYILRGRK